jgi:hypothetical protein
MTAPRVTNEKLHEQLSLMFTQFESLIARIAAMEAQQKAASAAIAPKAQRQQQPTSESRPLRITQGPWRLELEAFLEYKEDVECDWSDGANQKVGQALAIACGRGSGHAEGQLYIEWRDSVEPETVLAFWNSVGHYDRDGTHHKTGIPPGL